jgi:hypothetical protein
MPCYLGKWVSCHLHLAFIIMIRACLPYPCLFNVAQFLFLNVFLTSLWLKSSELEVPNLENSGKNELRSSYSLSHHPPELQYPESESFSIAPNIVSL